MRDQKGRTTAVPHEADSDIEEHAVSDAVPGAAGGEKPLASSARPEADFTRRPKAGGGLRIYKPNQGYYTRMGTVIGAVVLIIAGGAFLYDQIGNIISANASYRLPLTYGIPTAFMVIMAGLVYWVVGLNRKANDFFIATEGEMKKVNWSTKKEVYRSTKVVIATVVLMAILLFVVDIGFMLFFKAIHVQRSGPSFLELFGGNT